MISRSFIALGLMSGTSLDGIDVALVETDGRDCAKPLGFAFYPYEAEFRDYLRAHLGRREGLEAVERAVTERHVAAVQAFRGAHPCEPELIGFHGHTIGHWPEEGLTLQVGDGAALARATNIPVVNDFRTADVKAGGQGAPLVPLYHRALARDLPKSVAILNIGGVANVTWIGEEIWAFDTGPGNALIDDWMLRHTGQSYDADGRCAAEGRVDEAHVRRFLEHPYFMRKPPKSLDRDVWRGQMPEGLGVADGAATLTAMTAQAVAVGLRHVPQPPLHLYVTGGGRHNGTLMRGIAELTHIPTSPVEALGWNGDALEAEAFAYLAVRSRLGLPLSLPTTTGVREAMTGGRFHEA